MSWSAGTYRKGNYATNGWTGDASLGIGIEAGRHDTQDDDFATGINNCLTKDGQNTPTVNLPMGGFKHTGCGAASADTDYTTLGDVKAGISTQNTALTINNTQFSADNLGSVIGIRKSRGASVGTNTIVQSGDILGSLFFYGADGTTYQSSCGLRGVVDGVPGATNDMPGRLEFYTKADNSSALAERMRITNAGRVGIGSGVPDTFVKMVNAESSSLNTLGIASNVTGDVATHALVIQKFDNNSTTTQRFVSFTINAGTAASGQINANGASQAAFGSFSDARLKENITNLPSQIANIMALRPVEFDYKDGSGHQIGFIAQEVQEIYPDLIGDDGNGYLTLSGLGKNEARMIKAFQEFADQTKTIIDGLTARIEALEAK